MPNNVYFGKEFWWKKATPVDKREMVHGSVLTGQGIDLFCIWLLLVFIRAKGESNFLVSELYFVLCDTSLCMATYSTTTSTHDLVEIKNFILYRKCQQII